MALRLNRLGNECQVLRANSTSAIHEVLAYRIYQDKGRTRNGEHSCRTSAGSLSRSLHFTIHTIESQTPSSLSHLTYAQIEKADHKRGPGNMDMVQRSSDDAPAKPSTPNWGMCSGCLNCTATLRNSEQVPEPCYQIAPCLIYA